MNLIRKPWFECGKQIPLPNWVLDVHHEACPVEVNLPFILMIGTSEVHCGNVTKHTLLLS